MDLEVEVETIDDVKLENDVASADTVDSAADVLKLKAANEELAMVELLTNGALEVAKLEVVDETLAVVNLIVPDEASEAAKLDVADNASEVVRL